LLRLITLATYLRLVLSSNQPMTYYTPASISGRIGILTKNKSTARNAVSLLTAVKAGRNLSPLSSHRGSGLELIKQRHPVRTRRFHVKERRTFRSLPILITQSVQRFSTVYRQGRDTLSSLCSFSYILRTLFQGISQSEHRSLTYI
jgi:hypothetical protein